MHRTNSINNPITKQGRTHSNHLISNLRVLAILFVVFGHSIIIYDPVWTTYSTPYHSTFLVALKHFINLFQMELFFSLSGFLFFYTAQKGFQFNTLLKKKFVRLIIPFLFIGLFYLIPMRFIADYPPYENLSFLRIVYSVLSFNDCGHLWFLPTLFGIFIVAAILTYKNKLRVEYMLCIIAILYILSPYFESMILRATSKYLLFFFLGYFINKYKTFLLNHQRRFIYSGLAIIGFFLISYILVWHNQSRIIISLTSTIIIITLYYFTPHKTNRCISWLDKNCYGIYLFHTPLMYVVMNNISSMAPPAILVPMNLIFGIGGSLIIVYFLRAIKCSFIIGG